VTSEKQELNLNRVAALNIEMVTVCSAVWNASLPIRALHELKKGLELAR
jgi:hypothetical protein